MKRPSSWHGHVGALLVPAATLAAAFTLALPATSAADGPACPAADPISNTAGQCAATEEPVATLDPAWSAQFEPPRVPAIRSLTLCLPVEAVFYAQTDWYRLAQKLVGSASSCASYYVSVPPLAADKTRLRANEAPRIRLLGSQMHALAEINVTGWSAWVAAGNGTWFDAGVEARQRMAAAGFDVAAGDTWAVNEFSSAVRTGSGAARQNMRDLVRGLYTGDGTAPTPGLVWVAGIGQPTTSLGTYKTNLKAWLGDAAFWDDMHSYVRFFSQEVYGSVTNWAVPGTAPGDRLRPLADYETHLGILNGRAPADLATVSAYLRDADAPTANAAWPGSAYGWPPASSPAPSAAAQAYVAAQVYALRHEQATRGTQSFGFAWNPTNLASPNTIPDFANQTAGILDRLAAAIGATSSPSDEPGLAACGPDLTWCASDLDGATFNLAWGMFHTWTQPAARSASATTAEDEPVTVALEGVDPDAGETLVYEPVAQPTHGSVTIDGAEATYTPAANRNGDDSFTFRVTDGVMYSSAATVSVEVTPVNDAPIVSIEPVPAVDEGAEPVPLVAHASDVDGDAVTLTWSTPNGSASFAADDGPATRSVSVTANDGNGGVVTASVEIEVRNVAPAAAAGDDVASAWGFPVTLRGSGTDASRADAESLAASWDFGDGSTAGAGFLAQHTYAAPGAYVATLTVSDKDGGSDTDTVTVTVGPRPATLAYASPAGIDADRAAVAARLGDGADAATAALGGHLITFAAGTTGCSARTDETGVARCTLPGAVALGPGTVTVGFAGDTQYRTANGAADVVFFRFPVAGTFAVGDLSAEGMVTFWSPSWWLTNRLSGGTAPASFKGFVVTGSNGWTASPGFDHVPTTIPEWIGVVAARRVTKAGPTIRVDAARIVVVHVSTYDPALVGTGTVVSETE